MKDVWVHEFVKTCDACHSTNGAKFMKTVTPLHPIYLYNLVFGIKLVAIKTTLS